MNTDRVHPTTVFSAMLLVAGACVGGGMLALPLATGLSGFFPSLCVMALCWLAMTATGLLLVESSLWLEEGAHYISMSQALLGKYAKGISWALYLFIGYTSLIAYTAGGGVEMARFIGWITGMTFSKLTGCLLFFVLFGVVIDFGAKVVGRVNAVLFTGMIVSYFALVSSGITHVSLDLLSHEKWHYSYMAIPILLTSFSFQTMAPSLTPYLKRNVNALRIAIIGGTTLAFIIYIFWLLLILGSIPPEGPNSLASAIANGEPATYFIHSSAAGQWFSMLAVFFTFFAVVTSFLGVGLGLFDFLADGLHISKKGAGKWFLGSLIALPTIFFAVYFEQVFLYAMDLSGGFGDAILSGIIPVLMVWAGRYYQGRKGSRLVPGGKVALIMILLCFVASLAIECLVQIGWISSIFDVDEKYLV